MKILLVHKTKRGGVSVHVSYLKKYLKKFGYEVYEISRVEDLKLRNFVKSYQKMKKLFKEWSKKYDIIHTHDWSITYPAIKAKIENLVATFHGLPVNLIAKYFEDYSIKKLGKKAIVVSPFMLKRYPNAAYIPNGVDMNIFRKDENIEREKFVIGLAQKYNREKIIKIAKKLGFKIKIAEEISNEEMYKFYSMIDVFVSIPPKTTGFNMVWLEAMACEVPYVIGTNYGIGEILPIYKVNNFKELEILLKEIKTENLPSLKGTRNWIIENGFTWENHVRNLINLYKSIV